MMLALDGEIHVGNIFQKLKWFEHKMAQRNKTVYPKVKDVFDIFITYVERSIGFCMCSRK